MDDLKEQLKLAARKLEQLHQKLGIPQKEEERKRLMEASQSSGFWVNESQARKTLQRLSNLDQDIQQIQHLSAMIADATIAAELDMVEELKEKVSEIAKDLEQVEQKTYLSGQHDASDTILAVHAGQGGIEAMDWAAMLLRMYQRHADRLGWKWELVDFQRGEEAGVKSATLLIHGKDSFGYLRSEKGTHRLVRQSPFNADHLRQTSFALVEVMPVIEENTELSINPEEIEFEAFRSSGKGGQNVNKVSTAVRLRHRPTGISVSCQSQRYQDQNRKIALQLLRAKVWELQEQRRQEHIRRLKGEHVQPSWGSQIRSYVLQPYKLVKDLRTGVESRDPEAVLDGNLDEFIAAELRLLSPVGS